MLSLNIETSTNLTSVSLSEVNGVKEILNVNSERPNHCELLVPLITELFVKSSITIENINQIRDIYFFYLKTMCRIGNCSFKDLMYNSFEI